MNNNLKDWIGGIISAASGGISGAVAGAVLDPEHFNIHSPKVFELAIVAAIVPVFAYLKQRPLPGITEPDKNQPKG